MKQRRSRRDFPGKRWLSVGLRSAHLAGVFLLGAALLGSNVDRTAAALLMLLTGTVLYALDLWSNPAHLMELAGVFIAVKLLVVLAMALQPELASPLFCVVFLASSVVSHAPRRFRHRRIWN